METQDLDANWNCLKSIGTCFLLSVIYVSSFYVWDSQHHRNHPSTIKKRFLSVTVMMFISPLFLYASINKNILNKFTLWEILGLRTEGIIEACFMPLLLTMILFLGPLSMQVLNRLLNTYSESTDDNNTNLIWVRNQIVAPCSEEFTFRSCMLPLLLQCFRPITAVMICPLFFGVAHFHHMIEKTRLGVDFKIAFLVSCFHFTYTTIFGAYSAYIFYRSRHFASCFIAHAFCNYMGLPDLKELANYEERQRAFVVVLFFVGFFAWCFLLQPLTEPIWYKNNVMS